MKLYDEDGKYIATLHLVDEIPEVPEVIEHDFSTKEGVLAAIAWECKSQGIGSLEQIAYVQATADWETNHTMKPVKEAYWLSEQWRKDNLRYYPYYGRGYVQLTWESNYKKYADILGYDIVKDPDRVMNENVALFILVHGFKHGTFTGKRLGDYVNDIMVDFINARRCINGTDRAVEIATQAEEFLRGDYYNA